MTLISFQILRSQQLVNISKKFKFNLTIQLSPRFHQQNTLTKPFNFLILLKRPHMFTQQKLTSIKRINKHFNTSDMMSPSSKSIFMSPASKNILEEQLQELQLLSPEELVQKLQTKKQQVIRQSDQIAQNCHSYFIDFTSLLIQVENSIKKNIDAQTLAFLQEIQHKIDTIKQNQHSYNCNSQLYQTLKLLLKNYTETQEPKSQLKKILSNCYSVSLQGFTQTSTQIHMNTTDNKIYISGSEFITTNKKIHGTSLEITQKEFQLALAKFQQREEKQMLLNERLRNKVKSLEEMLSKKGLNIKQFNKSTSAQNERTSQDYWDLELQRVKAQNVILTQEITLISNKLIELTSQNQTLKSEYKKVIQSNISQISNQNNTLGEALNLDQHSRLQTNNLIPSQTIISTTIRDINGRDQQGTSGIFVQSNLFQNNIHNQMLIEYERKIEYLSVELTRKMKQIQELRGQLQKKDKQLQQVTQLSEQKSHQLQKVCYELDRLSNHSSTLEHDYEVSSKKKFQLQERISSLKQQLKQSKSKQSHSSLQSKLQIDNLQTLLKLKDQDIIKLKQQFSTQINHQLQSKSQQLKLVNKGLQQQIFKLKSTIAQNKSDYEAQSSQFKEQFKKLQITITSKDQQISTLMEQLYQKNKINQQTQEQNSATFKEKYETNKKEITKLKKQLKDKNKQLDCLKTSTDQLNQLQIKALQISTHIQSLGKEVQKIRSFHQAKLKLMEEKIHIIKDKHSIQLNQLIAQSNGQCKKANLIDSIDKYSESMNSYAQKTAQLKKLKDQIKQLKSSKPTNPKNTKKQLHRDPQILKKLLETNQQQVAQIQISIREDRIKIQKSIFQQKLSILEEEKHLLSISLQSKQRHIKAIQDQSQRLKKQVKNTDQCLKKQSNQHQLKSQINSLQNKVQKLQSDLRSTKIQLKKSTEELSSLQAQLKKKKDHISNVKKQLTSNQDQLQQQNFLLKNKSEQIQKLKRQLKDQSTKQNLLAQMKQKVESYQQLQLANQQLKKQIDKINSSNKFQINKLNNQIKELKTQRKQQVIQKVSSKTSQLNQELNDLKGKYKKLKTELQRKQTLTQHLKSKSDTQIAQIRTQLQQTIKQLARKTKQNQNSQKRLQTITLNQRKYKEKCKLLTVVLQKVYTRMLNDNSKPKFKHTSNKQNTLLYNTSPISQVINSNLFNSNLFNTTVSPSVSKQKDPSTLDTFKQLDINLQDLEKYSEGLQMFGVNTYELKSMQKELGLENKNETSAISYLMASPENKYDTVRNNNFVRSGINEWDPKYNQIDEHSRMNASGDVKEKVNKLSQCLNGKEQIDVAQVLQFFDQVIQDLQ